MIKCLNYWCPYYERIDIRIKNKEIRNECCKNFHPRGYCQRLDEFCDTDYEGKDCR